MCMGWGGGGEGGCAPSAATGVEPGVVGPKCLWCSNWSGCGCGTESVTTSEDRAGPASEWVTQPGSKGGSESLRERPKEIGETRGVPASFLCE